MTQNSPSITCLLRVTSHGSPTAFHAAGVGVRPRSLRGDPSSRMATAEEDKVEIPTVGQLCRHNVRVAAARNCAELARCALSCRMRASCFKCASQSHPWFGPDRGVSVTTATTGGHADAIQRSHEYGTTLRSFGINYWDQCGKQKKLD